MRLFSIFSGIILPLLLWSCAAEEKEIGVEVYETSASGKKLERLKKFDVGENPITINILPEKKYQTITGFGGAFTESSATLLNGLSKEKRDLVLNAYFSEEGANYSLTRTHINSCDFSLGNYSYDSVPGDTALKHFSVKPDENDLIPMIKDAMAISKDGFKILASPWTAPPWMKDNKHWIGGKLLPEYYNTWALFFSKYIDEYKKQGIGIWGVTVENEPLGNGNNWESMIFSPEETVDFVKNHLGPKLEADHKDVLILGYDQNRGEHLKMWADVMFKDEETAKYFDGTAVHWYASTYDHMGESLEYTYEKAPGKYIIQSEACIDAEVPKWKDDAWYWRKEATDWGWDWAPEQDKKYHPKYVPVYRYARDIIGCMNSYVDGWIDWNMVLDKQGGPNWFKNWCIAPVLADTANDEVYFTPLYYTMVHFSKYIRPGAVRIGFEVSDKELLVTAAENPDGSIAVVLLNMGNTAKSIKLSLGEKSIELKIDERALQTIVVSS